MASNPSDPESAPAEAQAAATPKPIAKSPSRIIGVQPSPRALIMGFEPERASKLQDLFSTSKIISEPEVVRQAEWDVIVTTRALLRKSGKFYLRAEKHLFVLAFGGTHDGHGQQPKGFQPVLLGVDFSRNSFATEFEIPPGLPPGVEQLVATDLLPWVQQQPMNKGLVTGTPEGEGDGHATLSGQPFLRTTAGEALACAFRECPADG